MLFGNVVAGSIAGMAVFILRIIPDTMAAGDDMKTYLKAVPNYAISNSIIYDGSKVTFNSTRTFARYLDPTINKATLEDWDLDNVGGDLAAMGLHFCFGMFVVIFFELISGACSGGNKKNLSETNSNTV